MSSIWTRSTADTPGYDCGLCGYPKCANFARAALVELVAVDKCPLLRLNHFKQQRESLQELVRKKTGLRFKVAAELPEGGVLLTKPCKDTDQKVMAELRIHNGVPAGEKVLFGVFDPILLCNLVECLGGKFEQVKCSKDLGYGKAETGELSITILQDGRVNMRRVDSREQVIEVFQSIERVIIGSTVCNCCGNDLISVVSGYVEHQDEHTVLDCGSTSKLDCSVLSPKLSFAFVKDVFGDVDALQQLNSVIHDISTFLAKTVDAGFDTSYRLADSIRCNLTSMIRDGATPKQLTIFLRLLALLWILESAVNAMDEIRSILSTMNEDQQAKANELISAAYSGSSSHPPSMKDEGLFRIFALSKCLSRMQQAVADWIDG